MRLADIPITDIIPAAYNPSNRNITDRFLESIRKYGIIEPLLLTDSHQLIDGHRRLLAAKTLKFNTVPCVLRNGTSNSIKDVLYLEANQHKRKISGADQVEIYKKGGKIEDRYLKPLLSLIAIADRGIINLMLKYHQNPRNIWNTYVKLKNYCNFRDSKKVIYWICNNQASYTIRRAIESGVKPSVIRKAVQKNANLKQIWITQ